MSPTRLLVVDDDPQVLDVLPSYFTEADGFVLAGTAADGFQALDAVARLHVDLVLTDVRMPGMDGVELARRLAQNPHGPGCLALTSYNDEVAMVTLLRAGARGYVKKSAPPEEIRRAAKVAAGGGVVMSGQVAAALRSNLRHPEPPTDGFTDREMSVLRQVLLGKSNKGIATDLHLAEGIVKKYVSALLLKFGVPSRLELVVRAMERGFRP